MRGRVGPAAMLAAAVLAAASVAGWGIAPAAAQQRAQIVARPAPAQPVTFDVYLKLRASAALDALLEAQQRPGSPQYHRWLTPAEFASRFGADPAQVARVTVALQAAGLHVRASGSHALRVSGPATAVEHAFSTRLANGRFADGHARLIAETEPVLPSALANVGAVVAHFAPVEHMHRHSHVVARGLPANRNGTTGFYWFDDLKQAYRFPAYQLANGQGAKIGILMANAFRPADMDLYFANENILPPQITTENVFGGAPFDPNLSDETTLDIQQAGGMAPLAAITLYNVPDLSDAALLGALANIVEENTVDIVSMSFGDAEAAYAPDYNGGVDYTGVLLAYDDLFRQGNAQGITFVTSSGDLGANSIPVPACFAAGATHKCGGFATSAETPASDPHVTAVGGTNLLTNYDSTDPNDLISTYLSENAQPDPLAADIFYGTPAVHGLWGSGGGISAVFRQPKYQTGASTLSSTHRIVPDVALQMGGCPMGAKTPCAPDRSGVVAVLAGKAIGLVGTSAAAPEFAGLLALKVQLTGGRLGNENPDIYAQGQAQAAGTLPRAFHDRIAGNNGHYRATPGYNAVLGNGTPIANVFLGLAGKPVAGNPQTPSNP